MNVANFAAHWSLDWVIIAVAAVIIAIDALRSGTTRVAALVVALPATLLLFQTLPNAVLVGSITRGVPPTGQVVLFAALLVLVYLLAHRMVSSYSDAGGPLPALVAGLAGVAVLMVVWLQVPALSAAWTFGSQVQAIFAEGYRFWWLLIVYVVLAWARS